MNLDEDAIKRWSYGTDTMAASAAGAIDDVITINSIDTFDLGTAAPAVIITSSGTGTNGASPYTSYPYNGNDFSINPASSDSGKISLSGDDADIEINGESVVSMLRDIRDRLNILQVSEDMEREWDELRELRQQYEAKLAECREKSRAWAALKKI